MNLDKGLTGIARITYICLASIRHKTITMKKFLLSVLSISLISGAFAQAVSINLDGSATDISGMTETYLLTGAVSDHHMVDFIVNNDTGSNQPWIITRRHISNPTGWEEYLCWGLNGAIGNCYVHDPAAIWSSGSEVILSDSSGRLSTYITCSTSGTATYRYYVSTDGQNFVDSVDLMVTNSLGIDEKPSFTVTVAPNPATDFITINATGSNETTVRIVDVLGNIVLNETTFSGKKSIDITRFRNGVYFVMIEADGVKPVTRKVIVRH